MARAARPRREARPTKPPCEHCGRPARGPELGPWKFCRRRCRAAFLLSRSRKASSAGKRLKCPLCGKGNPAKARRCAHCKGRILWRERSVLWLAVVWSFRVLLLVMLAGIGYLAYQFRDIGSAFQGGLAVPDALVALMGSPGAAGGAGGLLAAGLATGGPTPEQAQALLDRIGHRAGPAPKLPGPGAYLVSQGGLPPLLLGEDPGGPGLFPPGFGTMSMAEKGRAVTGMVSSGKVKVYLRPTRIRIVEPGEAFAQVEILEGRDTGATGWALLTQIATN